MPVESLDLGQVEKSDSGKKPGFNDLGFIERIPETTKTEVHATPGGPGSATAQWVENRGRMQRPPGAASVGDASGRDLRRY
jgi:hypothetical protein